MAAVLFQEVTSGDPSKKIQYYFITGVSSGIGRALGFTALYVWNPTEVPWPTSFYGNSAPAGTKVVVLEMRGRRQSFLNV